MSIQDQIERISGAITDQESLIAQIKEALKGKVAGGTVEVVLQSKTVAPSKTAQEVTADSGYTALGKVTVEAIPGEYVVPSGELQVTENGTHDVTAYASVNVNVPDREPVIAQLTVTENGTYNAPVGYDGFAPITVNVPVKEPLLQEKTVTENGEVTPDDGYDGLSKVTVNVPTGGVSEPDPRDLYQPVEYITSAEEDTYPYIITDFYADNESGMEIIASFPELQDRIPMGSRENSDATRFYCAYPMSANSIYYGFNTGSSVSCQLKVNTIYRLQTNFLNSRLINAYEKSGTRKGGTAISGTLSPAHTVPVSIFGYNHAGTGSVSSKREYKLYRARCSKKHEVVREYIPCYRKSDGVVGVYEKFTQTFWTTPTGSFAKGEDTDWEAIG